MQHAQRRHAAIMFAKQEGAAVGADGVKQQFEQRIADADESLNRRRREADVRERHLVRRFARGQARRRGDQI